MKKLLSVLMMLISANTYAADQGNSIYFDPISLSENVYYISSQKQIFEKFALELGVIINNPASDTAPSTYGFNLNGKYYFNRYMDGPYVALGRGSLTFIQNISIASSGNGYTLAVGTEIPVTDTITINPSLNYAEFPDVGATVVGYGLLIGFRT